MLLAARERLDVEHILAGAMRSRRHSTNNAPNPKNGPIHVIEPPWEIVREVLRATSWCKTIQHNDFILTEDFFHITTEFTPYIAKSRFWDVSQALARNLEEGLYELQGFGEHVEIKSLPSGSTRIKKLVSKIIAMGIKPGMRLGMAISPRRRLICIQPITREEASVR